MDSKLGVIERPKNSSPATALTSGVVNFDRPDEKRRNTSAKRLSIILECAPDFQRHPDGIAFHNAIRSHDLERVKALLEDPETNINQQDSDGRTALMVAVEAYEQAIPKVRIVDTSSNLEIETSRKAKSSLAELAHKVLSKTGRMLEIMRKIAWHHRTDLNLTDHNGDTALIYAARSGHFGLICDMNAGSVINKVPLKIDHTNKDNETALSIAIKKRKTYSVNQLINSSIRVTNMKNIRPKELSEFISMQYLEYQCTGIELHLNIASKLYELYQDRSTVVWPLKISLYGMLGSAIVANLLSYTFPSIDYIVSKLYAVSALVFITAAIYRVNRDSEMEQLNHRLLNKSQHHPYRYDAFRNTPKVSGKTDRSEEIASIIDRKESSMIVTRR